MPEVQSQDAHAYREGQIARGAGKSRDDNPYPPHVADRFIWELGWLTQPNESGASREGEDNLDRPGARRPPDAI